MRVLVVEDEVKLCSLIKKVLEENGYEVDIAYDGQIGEKLALKRDYDIIILDIIIPGINGVELCKIIKKQKPTVPIIMLTALGTTEDKVTGLESGADDYLLKPFEFAELIARMRAVTRRAGSSQASPPAMLEYKDLKLDLNKKVVIRAKKTINLTAKEFQILEYFMQNQGRVIPRAELAEKIWDFKFDTGTNVVEVYMNILRKKIDRDFEPKLLHTRIGLGYILTVDP
jgi:two-component system, OmpR family, copper resistance phosphate regulon response regulator CusR